MPLATRILPASDPAGIAEAITRIHAGEVVAFPTETVYGLGADATNSVAVDKIFAAKGRPATDPLIVHCASLEDVPRVIGLKWSDLPPAALLLARTCWPGPLTLILPRGPLIPSNVSAGLETIGVRVPAHPIAQVLLRAVQVPLAAPSANRFGHTSPTTAQHVWDDLQGRIPLILDGGATSVGVESTIIDPLNDPPRLLRPGGVALETIAAILGEPLARADRTALAEQETAQAPGMLLTHYAPRAPLLVIVGHDADLVWGRVMAEIRQQGDAGRLIGALVPADRCNEAQDAGAAYVLSSGDGESSEAVARTLFANLRALDDAHPDSIITGIAERTGLGLAVYDRLWRAASGQVIEID